MGYNNVLFNGKSMRNAIITKLSEDKHLTSALFANSNITILIDIISYMYQCLMSNLRQAASESMWSDTIFFENATRLAKMIGYYAKGQNPYTLLGRLSSDSINIGNVDFGEVAFGYGPYQYDFAIVEHNVNNDKTLVKLALGRWVEQKGMISDGTKYQEFVIERKIIDYDNPSFISQKYVRVFVKDPDTNEEIEWTYSPNPLFLIQNNSYTSLNAEDANGARTLVANQPNQSETRLFNFYIDENGNYVLKFGDGISTDIPKNGSEIIVRYISSTETDKTITSAAIAALSNATSERVTFPTFVEQDENGTSDTTVQCIPITTLTGYKDRDDAESIRENSRSSFSRQNRLVTKEDYKTFILENYPEFRDVVVQNNWEYVSNFYGWIYANATKMGEDPLEYINTNKLEPFNSSDLADANNVYIWTLNKTAIDPNNQNAIQDGVNYGINRSFESGSDSTIGSGGSIGSIKDITERPIFLYALCQRFIPCAISDPVGLNYNNPDPFITFDEDGKSVKKLSFFRIHIDSNYSSSQNIIKSKVYSLFKEYLFDNIKLGKTPNVPALIKDLMGIDGVINITTVYNDNPDGNIETEIEENGMRFCTWTDTDNQLMAPESSREVSYNLPNINCFQYFKSTQPFTDFIKNSLDFKIDYSVRS